MTQAENIDDSNELALIKGIISGSRASFRQVFDTYQGMVYHMARKLNLSHEDAQEIVQDVFVKFWEQRHQLRVDGSLSGLLFIISKRMIIKRIRKIIHERSYLAQLQYLVTHSNETEDYVIFSDLVACASQLIDQLSPKRKQIFMLSKNQGLSNEEIAKKLNLSKRTVENQLYRAIQQVKRYLKNNRIISLILFLLMSVLA